MDLVMVIMTVVIAGLLSVVVYRCWKVEKDTEYLDDVYEELNK